MIGTLFRGLLYSLVFPVLCQFLNLSGLVEPILQNCWRLVSFWRLEIVAVHGNEQVIQISSRRMGRRLVLYLALLDSFLSSAIIYLIWCDG